MASAFATMVFTWAITDWNETICDEMQSMVDKGVPSFKMYMAYKNVFTSR